MSKRLLVVSCNLPYPPETQTHGVFQRLDMFLKAGSTLVTQIDLLFFASPELASEAVRLRVQETLAAKYAKDITVTIVAVAGRPKESFYRDWILGCFDIFQQGGFAPYCEPAALDAIDQALAQRPDLVLAHRLSAMMPLLRRHRVLPPLLFDLDDIEHRALYRTVMTSTGWWMRKLFLAHIPALAWAEVRAVHRAAQTFVCSETDRRYLSRLALSKSRVAVVPNTVDMPATVSYEEGGTVVLFVGTFTHLPNIQAANELIDIVWPMIKRDVPAAQLLIAGKSPENLRAVGCNSADVRVLGFVSDLDALYSSASVMCCPIRAGSGTRIKIIEAAGHGVPVVSTALGAEGLVYRDGHEIILGETAKSLAAACVRLLRDARLRREIGQAARARTAAHYDRRHVIEEVRRWMAQPLGAAG